MMSPEIWTPSIIAEIKTALMGPLAGIGDTVWAGLIKPIILSVTLGMGYAGICMGCLGLWYRCYPAGLAITYFMFMRGYQLGMDSIDRFLKAASLRKSPPSLVSSDSSVWVP